MNFKYENFESALQREYLDKFYKINTKHILIKLNFKSAAKEHDEIELLL